MQLKPFKSVPILLAFSVILAVCLARALQMDLFERLEWITFDIRVRAAQGYSGPIATNLGFVFINEESIKRIWDGSLGYSFGLYWPRQVYGRVVEELSAQGARAVAFDVLFGELRPDHPWVKMADGSFMGPDDFFALQMRDANNVILAVTPEVIPPPLFMTNALALGDIETDKDSDGILRRAKAFRLYRHWHPAFQQLEADPEYGVDLRLARIEPRQIVLPRRDLEDIRVPLDDHGNFNLADFVGQKIPAHMAATAKPFTEERIWHLGIVLAARELNLDLAKAQIDFSRGHIILRSPSGLERVIPLDQDGYFYIDWSLVAEDPKLTKEVIHDLLAQNRRRLEGRTNDIANLWTGKLAIVGSSGVVGNNLTDRGATPLRPDTLLVSKHWNVANSVITGRFVQRSPLWLDMSLIAALGLIAAALTWQMRVLAASLLVTLAATAYAVIAIVLYGKTHYWIPMFFPLAGAMLMTHVGLITWRVLFEQAERRRVKSLFSTMVSPKIVQEVLQAEKLSLGGARREITVLFADMRGFTEFTDASQELVAETVRRNGLDSFTAEAHYDEQARETVKTINLYLGLVADTILQHDGTLDKFIGDCVMAFWGAPTPNPRHALTCVRAAIASQRIVHELNRHRSEDNKQRELENELRQHSGLPPRPLLPILLLGTGINTGTATVGLMGSESKSGIRQGNYTVLGREVNLASRLENASGSGRIFISESTYAHLRRDDPALAASCIALPPFTVKGIRTAICAYEVPWMTPHMAASDPPALASRATAQGLSPATEQ